MTTNTIIDQEEINEILGSGLEEGVDISSHTQSVGQGMEFHVRMDGYTLDAMESLIVETAAKRVLSGYGPQALDKKIQDAAIAMLSQKINQALEHVTKDMLDQPITPKMGSSTSAPVTMREFVGLCGRDFLSQKVDRDGKPSTSGYSTVAPRIEYIVINILTKQFSQAIADATAEIRKEAEAALTSKLDAMIATERERLSQAIGYQIGKKR
jgi:hypothetical protein